MSWSNPAGKLYLASCKSRTVFLLRLGIVIEYVPQPHTKSCEEDEYAPKRRSRERAQVKIPS